MFKSKLRTCCSFRVLIATLTLFCWALPFSYGQVKSSFTGIVTDPTGAVVPNAAVTVTNEATNVSVSRKTGTDGIYTIPDLLPGLYTLKAEAQGFKTLVNEHVELTVGYTQRVDFKLEVGAVTQEVTVTGQAPLVDTETNRMSELVTARQVQNLPLNGRNIFQLIQLAPGAVNTTGVIFEGAGNRGFFTVVNGTRPNMQGYLLDGITDKDLSGGSNTQPSIDAVQEFRVDTENLSAQYGSVVGAISSIVTKSGTNDFHGDAYEFVRNEKLDGREFFENKRNPFRMNQFGGTLGGPIKKNKLFFFGSYEGERTRVAIPQLVNVETPQWRNLVTTNTPNSVAALLYQNFPGPGVSSNVCAAGSSSPTTSCSLSLTDYVVNLSGTCSALDANCLSSTYGIDPTSALGQAILANPSTPMFGAVNASAPEEFRGQFFDGNQFSGRIDYHGDKNKVFGRYFFDRFSDPLYTPAANGGSVTAFSAVRGFTNPAKWDYPQAVFSWSHTFGPSVLNEFRAGWNRSVNFDVGPNHPGVPEITLDTGEVDFGSYNGYPQLFHEEIFHYSDMITLSRGRHNIKTGAEIQRNYENSEFNVGRPSYEFADSLFFAAGQVEAEVTGVDPGSVDPTTGRSMGQGHLASNIRAWRNLEFGAFFNDDWKVTPRLTLTLGLRYDLYTRHSEKYGHVTQFALPSAGANLTERLRAANCFEEISGATGFDGQPCNGGFSKKNGPLTTGDHNNFGPRVGFAWDVLGNGKTSFRGGFGVSYNGEIYNPLSNSRWNPPFYSFNLAFCGDGTNPPPLPNGQLNPGLSDACIFGPVNGGTPTFTGPPSNLGAGPAGATFHAFDGNIMGWYPFNSNAAFLTGIVFPNFRDPYVYGSHLSVEHEFPGQAVLKLSWVGTFGHKLYRAEDVNRQFAGRDLRIGSGPFPNGVCTSGRGPYRVNCLFGKLRVWENSVNSNYNALQIVLDKRMSHGLEAHANYVWSHSLDTRSTWHSGATTANGAAEGFSMDQAKPGLDYGHSIFDVRHRFSTSFVWELPWYSNQRGAIGHALGGWQINGALTLHGGFPWTPHCSDSSFPKNCDFNRDGTPNDRPNQPSFGNSASNDNTVFEPNHSTNLSASSFWDPTQKGGVCTPSPFPGCTNWTGAYEGGLARNTFRGPSFQEVDLSLFKNIKVSERVSFQFRAEAFNLFNRTNLQPPSTFLRSNPLFGLSSATYFPRQIQFALKMFW